MPLSRPSSRPSARLLLLLAVCSLTAACGSTQGVRATEGRPSTLAGKGNGWNGQIKIGNPYQVAGVWYYPADDHDYDETGIASWYGADFHDKLTANGEIFDMNEVSAAHKTLPMPSYVEVTNLANGRQMVVRVNDRGPFKPGRIIDLSRRAAQMLGFDAAGVTQVRVRRVYPADKPEVAALPPPRLLAANNGDDAPPPVATAEVVTAEVVTARVAPDLRPAPADPASAGWNDRVGGAVFVQVAALSDEGRAAWLAADIKRFGPSSIEPAAQGLYRVRIGPFLNRETADVVLAQVRAAGYADARVTSRPLS